MSDLKGTQVTWLGHSTVLVTTPAGTTLLIDPFMENNPTYPRDYPLPEKLDLILVTHGHYDHISDVIPQAKRTGAAVVAMFELANWFKSKGVEKILPMGYGGSHIRADVTVSMVRAFHSSGIDDNGTIVYGGEPAGFVITIKDGPVLYHAGDTDVYSDMQMIRDRYRPELGMLPIGGVYTMDPRGAATAAHLLELKAVLPLHYGTSPELAGTPAELREHIGDTGMQVLAIKPGESVR